MRNIDTVQQSSEINSMFDSLEKKIAPAPTPSVPALESGRQSAINSVFKIPYSPDAQFKSLCHACLRVVCHPTRQAMEMAHNEFFFCDCGGRLCSCEMCSYDAALLSRNGSAAVLGLASLGVIAPITGSFIYSPATGIVREQSK